MVSKDRPFKIDTPARRMLQDHLEKYAADGLKREIDYEEAVWRTLPAFVTPLGLLAVLLAYSFSVMFPDVPAPLSAIGLALIVIASGSGSLTIWQLRFSVKRRRHRYPPSETSICTYASQQREHYELHGQPGSDVDETVLQVVREFILAETAEAASHNHVLNASKLAARTKAARWLFWTTVFTLAAGADAALVKILSGA